MINIQNIINKIKSFNKNIVVFEIQASSGYDKLESKWNLFYKLILIIEEPSEDHGKYRAIELNRAKEKEENQLILKQASELANFFNVSLCSPDFEKTEHVPSWINTQKVIETHWTGVWQAARWEDNGNTVLETGTEKVFAANGRAADAKISQLLNTKYTDAYELSITIKEVLLQDGYSPFLTYSNGSYPKSIISVKEIRLYALNQNNYVALLKHIIHKSPGWTIKDLMKAICHSFNLRMLNVMLIKKWILKEIDDNEMNKNLSQLINLNHLWKTEISMRLDFEKGIVPSEFLPKYLHSGKLGFLHSLKNEFNLSLAIVSMLLDFIESGELIEADTLFLNSIASKK